MVGVATAPSVLATARRVRHDPSESKHIIQSTADRSMLLEFRMKLIWSRPWFTSA